MPSSALQSSRRSWLVWYRQVPRKRVFSSPSSSGEEKAHPSWALFLHGDVLWPQGPWGPPLST